MSVSFSLRQKKACNQQKKKRKSLVTVAGPLCHLGLHVVGVAGGGGNPELRRVGWGLSPGTAGRGLGGPGAPPNPGEAESLGGLIHHLFPGEGRAQMGDSDRRAGCSLRGSCRSPPSPELRKWGLVTGHLVRVLPTRVDRLQPKFLKCPTHPLGFSTGII